MSIGDPLLRHLIREVVGLEVSCRNTRPSQPKLFRDVSKQAYFADTRVAELDKSAAPGKDDEEDAKSISRSMSEDSAAPAADTLGTPGFIYECQKTLNKIQGILHIFGDPSNPVPRHIHQKSRFSVARLQSLKAKDLKWPMARSKTLELIGRLERHKATCTIALACTGIAGVYSVLRETELSNNCLAEIRAKQETMLKLQLSQEQGVFDPLISLIHPTFHEDTRLYRKTEQLLSNV